MRERILAIPDLHCPYVEKSKINKLLKCIEELNPTVVIQLGDLYDFISQSSFPKSIKMYDSVQETLDGKVVADEIWSAVSKRAPKAKKFQLLGNHDIRPLKRMQEKAPELEPFVDISKFFIFPGVNTILNPKETLEIEGIIFTHGHYSKIGQHALSIQKNVVNGHTHRGGVTSIRLHDHVINELWCGYLADPFHDALIYRPLVRHFNWHHGFGWWDKYGPRFIPL